MSEINMVCLDAQKSLISHWSVAWPDVFLCKSLEVLCKTVVGEVLSVGKADCLGNFFFSSHTLAIT